VITRRDRVCPILAWVALAVLIGWLHYLGRGALAGPPLRHPYAVLTWWAQRGAVTATFAALREALCAVGCYLWTVLTAMALAARIPSVGRAMARCRARLPGANALARAAFGASAVGAALAANATASFAAGAGNPSAPSSASTAPSTAGPSLTTTTAAPDPRDTGPFATPMLRYLGPARPPAPVTPLQPAPGTRAGPPTPPAPSASPGPPTPPAPGVGLGPHIPPAFRIGPARHSTGGSSDPATTTRPAELGPPPAELHQPGDAVAPSTAPGVELRAAGTWTVRPGDNLWSIAAATLSQAWGGPPPEADLARYWWRVVETNRAHLPNPADPNLLFPGDRVTVPPIPPRPGRPGPR
jgi:hypothetical protein